MCAKESSPVVKDKLANAVKAFSEIMQSHPEKNRDEIMQQVQLKYDLSPMECEFLDKHFSSGD
jgi:hypothetical protein